MKDAELKRFNLLMERRYHAMLIGQENEFNLIGEEISQMAEVLLAEHNVPGISERAKEKPKSTRSVFRY